MCVTKAIVAILAGGHGSRLGALTEHRAKPAVQFGAKYRIIDFALSNCVNSGTLFKEVYVLTQYKSHPLTKHIQDHWTQRIQGIMPVPSAQGFESDIFSGTADAILQSLDIFKQDHPDGIEDIVILAGDHIYAMDLKQFYDFHIQKESKFTICAMPIKVEDAAGEFGVLEVDSEWKVLGFEEKPETPKEIPGRQGWCLASMGMYIANFPFLEKTLKKNAENNWHDFGKDVIPKLIAAGMHPYVYDFSSHKLPGQDRLYWRDVGTIKSFHSANMDLATIDPSLDLYNKQWPIYTPADNLPPAKNMFPRNGSGICLTSGGCIIQSCLLSKENVFGRNVRAYNSTIERSFLTESVIVRDGCLIKNAIIGEGVEIPSGTRIGYDRQEDADRGFYFDRKDPTCDIVVIPSGYVFQK